METYNSSRFGAPSVSGWPWAAALEKHENNYWGEARWYDVQLEQRMPLAKTLLDELVFALPPCTDKRILDVCSGAGRAAKAVLQAYPEVGANIRVVVDSMLHVYAMWIFHVVYVCVLCEMAMLLWFCVCRICLS